MIGKRKAARLRDLAEEVARDEVRLATLEQVLKGIRKMASASETVPSSKLLATLEMADLEGP